MNLKILVSTFVKNHANGELILKNTPQQDVSSQNQYHLTF